jgi:hypothetical protein
MTLNEMQKTAAQRAYLLGFITQGVVAPGWSADYAKRAAVTLGKLQHFKEASIKPAIRKCL